MDNKFYLFDSWLKDRKKTWTDVGIRIVNEKHIEYATETAYHSYRIALSSPYGDGTICLFESNNIYWVDFEACNYEKNETFCLLNISFESIESVSGQIEEFEAFITNSGLNR